MQRKGDAFSIVLFGIFVNASDQNAVATLEENQENEATEMCGPAGQFFVLREEPEIEQRPDPSPDVHCAKEGDQLKHVDQQQSQETLQTCTTETHQRLDYKRQRHYYVAQYLKINILLLHHFSIHFFSKYFFSIKIISQWIFGKKFHFVNLKRENYWVINLL